MPSRRAERRQAPPAVRAQACRYSTAPALAEAAAEALDVADQRHRRLAPRRRPSGRRACAAPAPARPGPRSAGSPGTIPASAGKAASSDCAKLWMVWIFSPPGQSSTWANSCRARSPRLRIVRFAEVQQVGSELAVLQPHPGREPRADAVGHFGRRRLGEGEAEDRFRARALEQQPQHARGQHLRLAGSRRSRQRRVDRGSDASACSPLSSGKVLNRALMRLPKRASNAIEIGA